MYRESSLMINQQFWSQPQKKGQVFFLVKKRYHLPIFILIVNVALSLSVSFVLLGIFASADFTIELLIEYLNWLCFEIGKKLYNRGTRPM